MKTHHLDTMSERDEHRDHGRRTKDYHAPEALRNAIKDTEDRIRRAVHEENSQGQRHKVTVVLDAQA